jgi:hypothetical protein
MTLHAHKSRSRKNIFLPLCLFTRLGMVKSNYGCRFELKTQDIFIISPFTRSSSSLTISSSCFAFLSGVMCISKIHHLEVCLLVLREGQSVRIHLCSLSCGPTRRGEERCMQAGYGSVNSKEEPSPITVIIN